MVVVVVVIVKIVMNTVGMRIAGLPRQVLILLWKNGLLFRRNLFGTFLELVCPLLMLSVFLIMRYFIEKVNYPEQNNKPRSVLSFMNELFQLTLQTQLTVNRMSRNLIVYYPNTRLVETIATKAAAVIAANNNGFFPQSNFIFG